MAEIRCTLATVISVTAAVSVGKIVFSIVAYKKIVTHKLGCVFELHYNFQLQILLQLQK
jgi:uncharacterized protein (DUF1697 family)